jgi:hypothetical protein
MICDTEELPALTFVAIIAVTDKWLVRRLDFHKITCANRSERLDEHPRPISLQ